MSEIGLYNLLAQLPKTDFPNERSFVTATLPIFFEILGYEKSNVFFEALLLSRKEGVASRPVRADAIVATDRITGPWILVEAKRPHQPLRSEWETQLEAYREIASPEYAILFSPLFLVIYHNDSRRLYDLRNLTKSQASEIFSSLKKPHSLPSAAASKLPSQIQPIWHDTFQIDSVEYFKRWQSVVSVKKKAEMGKALEDLAALLFEGMPFLTVKYRNLQTSTSEIDLVVQNNGWNRRTIFDEFGRYSLVECKNWSAKIGAKHIRDFVGKLNKTQTKLGFFFARNGITGTRNGTDALREIHASFDSEGIYVIVLSEEDFIAIQNGSSFYDILDNRIDGLRFDT